MFLGNSGQVFLLGYFLVEPDVEGIGVHGFRLEVGPGECLQHLKVLVDMAWRLLNRRLFGFPLYLDQRIGSNGLCALGALVDELNQSLD